MQNYSKDQPQRFTRAARGALLASALFSTVAHAQTESGAADDAAGADEEITVTALKRNLSAQDTPATVAIVSGDLIAKTNITSALDLPAITPGVIIQSAPGALAVASIRGIGSNASNQSFDQSVALFVDGVFTARGRDYASSLFDVSDIQVIKGSQSAVLGMNTTIGAIAMNTNRPAFDFGTRTTTGFAVYDRHALEAGDRFPGPALIEEGTSTTVVHSGQQVEVDAHGYLLVTAAGSAR